MRYVALLRGINVGGNAKVPMPKLKNAFEELGYTNVVTFINSGNIVFTSNVKSIKKLVADIEKHLEKLFQFKIVVLIRDQSEIESIVAKVPNKISNDKVTKCDVLFLQDEINNKSILKEMPFDKTLEKLNYYDHALVWTISRENQPKSKMVKIIGTKMYKQLTIRNINTVRKILELMKQVEN